MVIGLAIGLVLRESTDSIIYHFVISMGTLFIRLLKMIIVPLIFSSIVVGVSSLGSGRALGRIGVKTFAYYFLTSLLAILIGLALTNLIAPGIGTSLAGSNAFDPSSLSKPGSIGEILIRMVPLNPIHAASTGDMLGIIFFSILLGVSISKVDGGSDSTIRRFFESLFKVMMKMTEMIIKLAPLGVLGLITKVVATTGLAIFVSVGKYVLTIALGLSLHILFVLPTIFYLFTGKNPVLHFRAMAPAMATAFSTSSSNATLPMTIKCIEKNAGVSNKVSSFVLPLGATINMDGTALYECAGVLFIAQVLGVDLTIYQQLIIVVTALLASIGAAGIPSAGLVMIFIVTQAVGFKDQEVALIVGTMLAVDRPLDMFRTVVNIFSDSVGTSLIAKSEGESLYNDMG
jgi:Na+/H+-dicarboxylate symporter